MQTLRIYGEGCKAIWSIILLESFAEPLYPRNRIRNISAPDVSLGQKLSDYIREYKYNSDYIFVERNGQIRWHTPVNVNLKY